MPNNKKAAELLKKVKDSVKKTNLVKFSIGDTVKVHTKIVEGNKERIQVFEGVVISMKRSDSDNASFTVRKISYNIGVEKTFPLHSPRVDKIDLVAKGSVRRAKLYYIRDLSGKAARIKTEYDEDAGNNSKKAAAAQTASADTDVKLEAAASAA